MTQIVDEVRLTERQQRALAVFAGHTDKVLRVALAEAEGLRALGLLQHDSDAWTGYRITDEGKKAIEAGGGR